MPRQAATTFNPATCLVLSCSPRAGGNSDTAARLFSEGCAQGLRNRLEDEDREGPEKSPPVFFLRDFAVKPCIACDACGKTALSLKNATPPLTLREFVNGDIEQAGSRHASARPPFHCPLTRSDASAPLLRAFAEATCICLVSPVYFYHLPAMCKALLDRMQTFWRTRTLMPGSAERFLALHRKTCRVILVAGQKHGRKLFAGALLSLKYAMSGIGARLAEPLLLRALDAPDDLKCSPEVMEQIRTYGREAGMELRASQENWRNNLYPEIGSSDA
ncbi:MAG: NAD(P)H-dependent oxidoreductase [Desulfovibrio sp.]|jgi:multimeric flavodoxin WrbA|nr:NAD(P)H-dependent oxidoreductase [Desulfovibrio sp.]